MDSRPSDDLSQRRQDMRAELIGAMTRRHRRRRMVRPAAAIVGLVALAGVLLMSVDRPRQPGNLAINDVEPAPSPVAPPSPVNRAAIITEVRTDPTVVDRYAATGTGLVQVISDAELLAALSDIDRPTGLIREAGAIHLTNDVLDSRDEESSRDG